MMRAGKTQPCTHSLGVHMVPGWVPNLAISSLVSSTSQGIVLESITSKCDAQALVCARTVSDTRYIHNFEFELKMGAGGWFLSPVSYDHRQVYNHQNLWRARGQVVILELIV